MPSRLKLDWVECRIDGPRTTARVQLSLGDAARTGQAAISDSDIAWQRATAEATLSAVLAFVGEAFGLSLDSVAEVRTGRHPLIVVTMLMQDGRGELFLSGTAPITDHPYTAVARAVLHGLNRWLEPLLERQTLPAPPRVERAGRSIH